MASGFSTLMMTALTIAIILYGSLLLSSVIQFNCYPTGKISVSPSSNLSFASKYSSGNGSTDALVHNSTNQVLFHGGDPCSSSNLYFHGNKSLSFPGNLYPFCEEVLFHGGNPAGTIAISPVQSSSSNFSITSNTIHGNSSANYDNKDFFCESFSQNSGITFEISAHNRSLSSTAGFCEEYSPYVARVPICKDFQSSNASPPPHNNVGQILLILAVPAFTILIWAVIKLIECCKDDHHRRARVSEVPVELEMAAV